MYYAYIIESTVSGRWYYGSTEDVPARVKRHQEGRSKATKGRGPWKLVATKAFDTRAEAMAFERKLKAAKNKAYALALIRA